MVYPVQLQRGLANHGRHGERHVLARETVVRARAEYQPVLRFCVGISRDPALWIKSIRVLIDLGVVESRIAGRDDHVSLLHRVARCHREVLRRNVRDEDNGWAVAEKLLYHGVGIGEGLQHAYLKRPVPITAARGKIFTSNAVQDLGPLRQDLEHPGGSAARGVLGSKEEGEQSLCDLQRRKVADEILRLFRLDAGCRLFVIGPRFHHVQHPLVDDAGRPGARRHVRLASSSTSRELFHDGSGCTLSQPRLGIRDVDGKGDVDKLESSGDKVEIVGNFLDSILRDVIPKECPTRQGAVYLSEPFHELHRLPVIFLASGDESIEIVGVHLILGRQVCAESLVREKAD